MPRPTKDDRRDRFRSFRFNDAEIARLRARARASGRTLSSYVRAKLLEVPASPAEPETGPVVTGKRRMAHGLSAEGTGLPEGDFARRMLAEQMRRVGVNLNQIAKRMNEQRILPPRELTDILADIRAYVRQAREP
jgi:hypothetical protein